MDTQKIVKAVDHTLLKPESTWVQIQEICDDALHYGAAAVCIPPSFVARAHAYTKGAIPIATVIGFPNGYNTTAVKCLETEDALKNGASEIDMVINIGDVKDGAFDRVLEEIKALKAVCGEKVLKVIIETALLNEAEKVKLSEIVTEAGADYIKTSTGFSTGGATFDDVALLKRSIGPKVKVKAAGGISSLSDAAQFLELGAERLGTSKVIKLIKDEAINPDEY